MLPTLNSFPQKINNQPQTYMAYIISRITETCEWIQRIRYEKLQKKQALKNCPSKTEAHSTLAINWCLEPFDCTHLQWFYEENIHNNIFHDKVFNDLYRVKLDWKYELPVASPDLQKDFYNFWNAGEIRTAESPR